MKTILIIIAMSIVLGLSYCYLTNSGEYPIFWTVDIFESSSKSYKKTLQNQFVNKCYNADEKIKTRLTVCNELKLQNRYFLTYSDYSTNEKKQSQEALRNLVFIINDLEKELK